MTTLISQTISPSLSLFLSVDLVAGCWCPPGNKQCPVHRRRCVQKINNNDNNLLTGLQPRSYDQAQTQRNTGRGCALTRGFMVCDHVPAAQ